MTLKPKFRWMAAAAIAPCFMSGCGTNIRPDMTIAQALAQIDILNQLTVGDLAEAFQQFAANLDESRGRPAGVAALTEEQRVALQSLQQQLDAGQITASEFDQQAREVVGDALPHMAFAGFGFMGAPFGRGFDMAHGRLLDLSDDQKTAARDIFTRLHEDIRTLRSDAHDKIRAVLTEDQRVQLDSLGLRRPGLFAADQAAQDAAPQRMRGPGDRPGPGPMAHMGSGPNHDRAFSRLAEALDLTDDQIAQIETIRSELRDAIRARHEQARNEFIAILDDVQRAMLTLIEGGI
ncbi:MAG: hypothetical protein HUU22_18590 [Phycisphaerae bacterium]|nr:hypothetical protein [Phycisphaerae bacterium]NUQ48025.1 hypothetical protein [Phycisphaerae bacterium]